MCGVCMITISSKLRQTLAQKTCFIFKFQKLTQSAVFSGESFISRYPVQWPRCAFCLLMSTQCLSWFCFGIRRSQCYAFSVVVVLFIWSHIVGAGSFIRLFSPCIVVLAFSKVEYKDLNGAALFFTALASAPKILNYATALNGLTAK